jgi:hypothetical protein
VGETAGLRRRSAEGAWLLHGMAACVRACVGGGGGGRRYGDFLESGQYMKQRGRFCTDDVPEGELCYLADEEGRSFEFNVPNADGAAAGAAAAPAPLWMICYVLM